MTAPIEYLTAVLDEREADARRIRDNVMSLRYGPNLNYELRETDGRTTTITRIPIYNADDELVRIGELRSLLEYYREAPDRVAVELLARSEGWTP
jgi:hypothetical protein